MREPSNWSRRFKNHQEKLKSGDVYQVAEVVRYERGGKWWHEADEVPAHPMWPLEGKKAIPASRTPLTISQAVALALAAVYAEHGMWFPGVPGGRTFDARVRKAMRGRQR